MVLWYLLSIHSSSNQNERRLTAKPTSSCTATKRQPTIGVSIFRRWCDQNSDGVKQIFKSVNNILMVWTKLCRCDPENRWCDQNLLWRCDLQNWWCDQNFYGVIKCEWCDETIFRCEQTSIFWKLCDHTVCCDLFTCFFLMLALSLARARSLSNGCDW